MVPYAQCSVGQPCGATRGVPGGTARGWPCSVQRLADFRDEQLGGAFYLFLRGMPEAGVYFARPDDALLDALDRLFEVGR